MGDTDDDPLSRLEVIDGATYGTGETVSLDGRHFRRCAFLGCTVMYGGGLIVLDDCTFDNVKPLFGGPAAFTIGLLEVMGLTDISAFVSIRPVVH